MRTRHWLAVAGALALTLTACSDSNDGETQSVGAGEPARAQDDTPAPPPPPSGTGRESTGSTTIPPAAESPAAPGVHETDAFVSIPLVSDGPPGARARDASYLPKEGKDRAKQSARANNHKRLRVLASTPDQVQPGEAGFATVFKESGGLRLRWTSDTRQLAFGVDKATKKIASEISTCADGTKVTVDGAEGCYTEVRGKGEQQNQLRWVTDAESFAVQVTGDVTLGQDQLMQLARSAKVDLLAE